MGLSYKEWKFRKLLVEILDKEFGISEDDLVYLPEALKIVRDRQVPVEYVEQPTVTTEKKTDEQKAEDFLKMTPQQMVAMFATDDIEEFKEDGR